ncbi:hypothetical protein [Micromonospora craniellae]|uniref:hypothetical protein n=1 Tax=Micromonospora craniellae TaxID=2294034 RepID=UPI0011C16271|nr:hypothetical protein [Micromonospora craniellae]QOC92440.1 hypothetical protein ID554_01180 [Micromonospora craniellae]
MTTVLAVAAGLTVWFSRPAPETDDTSGGPPRSVPVRFDPSQQLLRLGYLPGPIACVPQLGVDIGGGSGL